MIFIGKIIEEQLREQGKSVVWFARQMSCSRTKVYKIFDKYSIDTEELLRISIILDYNFFDFYFIKFYQEKERNHQVQSG